MRNGKPTGEFVESLLMALTDSSEDEKLLDYSQSSYRKFYNGREVRQLANKIQKYINKPVFEEYLENEISTDVVPLLIKDLENEGYKINEYNYCETICDLFVESLLNNSNEDKSKDKTTSVVNNFNIDGALSNQEILYTQLCDLNSMPLNRLNNQLATAEAIATTKLPDEIRTNYEVKYKNIGSESRFVLVPRSEEAEKSHPINFRCVFSAENNDLNRLKDIQTLLNEANRTNKYIEIGHPSSIVEKVGDYDNPLPIIPSEQIVSSTLFIGPTKNLKTITVRLYMFNEFVLFKSENITIQKLEEYGESCRFSNCRFDNDWFDFVLDYSPNNLKIHLSPRENARITTERWLQLYKYQLLRSDSSSTTRLYVDGIEKPLLEGHPDGEKTFTKHEIRKIKELIARLEKLIQIEDRIGYRFDFDYEAFSKDPLAVDILYSSLNKKKSNFKSQTTWSFEIKGALDPEIKIGTIQNVCGDLTYVEIFNKKIPVDGMCISIKDARVERIETKRNKHTIFYSTNHITLTPKEK